MFVYGRYNWLMFMGVLFPDGAEFPSYKPIPAIVFEAVRLGLPPLLIAAMLALDLSRQRDINEPQTTDEIVLLTPSSFPEIPFPHTHQELGDTTPRVTASAIVSSSSGRDVPFFSTVDSNDVVRQNYSRSNAAFIGAQSFSNPSVLFEFRSTGD
jgi:hypothetical protein